MGLFDRLLQKKQCAFCGGEIGMLGNKKLEDGDMCKNCASKLSPWFDDRRHSTVAQIGEQLAYREKNKEAVAQFQTTRKLGKETKVYLDETNRKFMITRSDNPVEVNPDVVDGSAVTNAAIDIHETKHELKTKDKDGKSVSYNPPRYDYAYDFFVDVDVDHPYFSRMRVKVNGASVWLRYKDVQARRMGANHGGVFGGAFSATGHLNGAGVKGAVVNGVLSGLGAGQTGADVYTPEYQEQLMIAQDMRDSLLRLRYAGEPSQVITESVQEPQAPAQEEVKPQQENTRWFCPECGAPNDRNFCTNCGTPRPKN